MTPSMVYWASLLGNLSVFSQVMIFASFTALLILVILFMLVDNKSEKSMEAKRHISKSVNFCVIFSVMMVMLFVITPSKETVYQMYDPCKSEMEQEYD